MRRFVLLIALLAGCTATQSRHVVPGPMSEAPPAIPGRVIADFEDPAALADWHKYVVEGSVHDPVAEVNGGALRVTSDSSAGLYWHQLQLDPVREPYLRWRWRVSENWGSGKALAPEFDNFPARLLVGFDSGWKGAGPAAQEFRRKVNDYTGVDPPARAICYTLGGRGAAGEAVDAAFGEGRIVVINLRGPGVDANQWHWQTRDIAADYRAIWGEPPLQVMAMAVGSDSHRVKKLVWAEFDDITAFPAEAAAQLRGEIETAPSERTLSPLAWWIIGLCTAVACGAAGWWVWHRKRA